MAPAANFWLRDTRQPRDPVVAKPFGHQLLYVVKFRFRPRHMRTYVRIGLGQINRVIATIATLPGE